MAKRSKDMKVFFKYGFSAYSGMVDQMVYQSWFDNRMCLSRRFSYPTLTANNAKIGASGKNLASIYGHADSAYRDDLKKYCNRYKKEHMPRNVELLHPMPGPTAMLVQMMFNWYDSDPTHIDLPTVTIADIVALDADVRTIARAVEAGFLPGIKLYTDLTNDIQ